MTQRKRSERSRWTTVFTLPEPSVGDASYAQHARDQHRQMLAVVKAFQKVGRAVRVEPGEWSSSIVLRARKS